MMNAPLASAANEASQEEVNLLVVDDVEQNLLAMEALLRRPGLRVLRARSGAEALELLLRHEVALALLDVQMPEMDGFAIAELMRGNQRTREVPIIFVTATASDPARLFRGYETGAVDFLYKPLDPHVIASKVEVFVELYRQRRLLRERNEALERALKLNETMVAVLTHDLRTPLAAIVNSAELLRLRAPDDLTLRAATRVRSGGQRMARMIGQLLEFCRIRSGVMTLQPHLGELRSVCEAAIEEIGDAYPGACVDLQAQGDLRARFDPDRLLQVLSNLMANALQHGDPSQPVQVLLDGTDEAQLRITVRNGGSLPEEVVPVLFEPFRRSAESPSTGLGLGLFIVDQFMRAHGGTASGGNTAQGVEFELRLPRKTEGRLSADAGASGALRDERLDRSA